MDSLIDPKMFVGRAPEQVDDFINEEITPVLEKFASDLKVANVDGVNV